MKIKLMELKNLEKDTLTVSELLTVGKVDMPDMVTVEKWNYS